MMMEQAIRCPSRSARPIHLREDDVRYLSAGVAERRGTRESALCSSSVRMDDACHSAQCGTYDRERREGKEVPLNELPPK
jgi:hypothetical protein